MSSRAGLERERMQESNSPLANHSMDNRNIKDAIEGGVRFPKITRKAERANLRRERWMKNFIEERVLRTKDWVTRALSTGYGTADYVQEIHYLRKHGIRVLDASKN